MSKSSLGNMRHPACAWLANSTQAAAAGALFQGAGQNPPLLSAAYGARKMLEHSLDHVGLRQDRQGSSHQQGFLLVHSLKFVLSARGYLSHLDESKIV
jgi:hypothetical protein